MVLHDVLHHWAAAKPDQVFAWFEDGEEWSYADTLARVQAVAAGLENLGVEQGDHVIAWLPNGKAALEVFFAINYLGAVYVPINTAYRGDLLTHVIDNADARLIVAHGGLVPRLNEVARARLDTCVVAGPEAAAVDGLRMVAYEAIRDGGARPKPRPQPIRPWHTQAIIYTSGTTGPSKGVLSSYIHADAGMNQTAWPCVTPADRFLINMPFFHIGGSYIVNAMLIRGGSIALTDGFRTEPFWRIVRESGSNVVFLLGAMASFLMKAPVRDDDRAHSLRTAFIVPLTEETVGFPDRFGSEVYTIFNMSEIATPIISSPNPRQPGYCGIPRAGFDVRLVDENDQSVAPGGIGEMILRADEPWTLNHGYYKNPAATAEAWRNGWFHTGDAFRQDSDGNFFFVDRIKDAIRRRGENISSAEVEAVILQHAAVQECAAIAVPSEFGEDEVMAVLALKPGATLAPEDLLEFLRPRMAHFMVPRYLRFLDSLPKTPTEKIQKAELRKDGVNAETWDREAAGVKIRAERLR
ncbi:MAG: ATP-dependent acyl-CoA ligase [Gammaproteobacteria bacterium]|nr:MAG: ATP-dependent acyl-CoA ligase [Gammaproteobacteria bacterium]